VEKEQDFSFISFYFFITRCQAPGSGGVTPLLVKKGEGDYQQNRHQLSEIPGVITAAIT